jgi:hypothetical protein
MGDCLTRRLVPGGGARGAGRAVRRFFRGRHGSAGADARPRLWARSGARRGTAAVRVLTSACWGWSRPVDKAHAGDERCGRRASNGSARKRTSGRARGRRRRTRTGRGPGTPRRQASGGGIGGQPGVLKTCSQYSLAPTRIAVSLTWATLAVVNVSGMACSMGLSRWPATLTASCTLPGERGMAPT